MSVFLIVPGLFDSGPDHWQSWLERCIAGCARANQDDWTIPDLARWAALVRQEINRSRAPVFLVAHSFGCLASVKAAEHSPYVAGAMLVAPPDPDRFDAGARLPRRSLGFPAVVAASETDPWMTAKKAASWASRWNAEFVNLGDAGHVNAESGFGPWPQGLSILRRLTRSQAPGEAASKRLGPKSHGSR